MNLQNTSNYWITCLLLVISSLFISSNYVAAPVACTGVAKQCTKDKPFDKTINGQPYSCYECKQTLCKGDGDGGIAGTKTTTECTSKPTGFVPITQDGMFTGGTDKLAPAKNSTGIKRLKSKFASKAKLTAQQKNQLPQKPSSQPPTTQASIVSTTNNAFQSGKFMSGDGMSTSFTCTDTTGPDGMSGTKTCECTGGRHSFDCKKMLNDCSNKDVSDLICNDVNCRCNKAITTNIKDHRPTLNSSVTSQIIAPNNISQTSTVILKKDVPKRTIRDHRNKKTTAKIKEQK